MKNLYYILLLLLVSCTPKQVNFWNVPITGSPDEFLHVIDKTDIITSQDSSHCIFLGMPMEYKTICKDNEISVLRLSGLNLVKPISEFNKQYGKEKTEGLGTYWDFPDGEIGMGILNDTLLINFIRY